MKGSKLYSTRFVRPKVTKLAAPENQNLYPSSGASNNLPLAHHIRSNQHATNMVRQDKISDKQSEWKPNHPDLRGRTADHRGCLDLYGNSPAYPDNVKTAYMSQEVILPPPHDKRRDILYGANDYDAAHLSGHRDNQSILRTTSSAPHTPVARANISNAGDDSISGTPQYDESTNVTNVIPLRASSINHQPLNHCALDLSVDTPYLNPAISESRALSDTASDAWDLEDTISKWYNEPEAKGWTPGKTSMVVIFFVSAALWCYIFFKLSSVIGIMT